MKRIRPSSLATLLLFTIIVLFLPSCVNFHGTDQSVWSEGGWIPPALTAVGALVFGYLAKRFENKEGFWPKGYAIFCALCVLATFIIILHQVFEA